MELLRFQEYGFGYNNMYLYTRVFSQPMGNGNYVSIRYSSDYGSIDYNIFDAYGSPVYDELVQLQRDGAWTGAARSAILADGKVVISWERGDADYEHTKVAFQILSTDGVPLSVKDFTASATSSTYEGSIAISSLSDGNFVLAWTNADSFGAATSSEFRIFNASGEAIVTDDISLDDGQTVVRDGGSFDGGFYINYNDYGDGDSVIRSKVFNNSGDVVGQFETEYEDYGVYGIGEGRFINAYYTKVHDGYVTDLFIDIYDNKGKSVVSGIEIFQKEELFQGLESVEKLSEDRFLVTWTEQRKSGPQTGYLAVFDSSGDQIGTTFVTNGGGNSLTRLSEQYYLYFDYPTGVGHQLSLLRSSDLTVAETWSVDEDIAYGAEVTVIDDDRFVLDYQRDSYIYQTVFTLDSAPTSIGLSKSDLLESTDVGDIIGSVSADDEDGDELKFELVNSAGGRIGLVDNKLVLRKMVDYEQVRNLELTIRATDPDGLSVDATFDLAVRDVAEKIRGSAADDAIAGGYGSDIIMGLAGDDILRGGKADDVVIGGRGNDRLFGDGGADRFAFELKGGTDRVMDFSIEFDTIDLSDVQAIKGFRDLSKHHVDYRNGDLTIVTGYDKIIVDGVGRGELSEIDFNF